MRKRIVASGLAVIFLFIFWCGAFSGILPGDDARAKAKTVAPAPLKEPKKTPAPVKTPRAIAQATKTPAGPTPTPHPVLGSIEQTWKYKETALDIRIDQRLIKQNRVFIAVVKSPVGRMNTFTVAGPGRSAAAKPTSTLAKNLESAFAINGDYFDYYTRRGRGIVVRNGIVFNNIPYGRWCYGVFENGSAQVVMDYDVDIEDWLLKDVKDVYAFGPALVKNKKFVKPKEENIHPRTAIGRINAKTWVYIVVDGRQKDWSVGMTYKELANIFIALGCDSAYNLDGGGSSAMYLKGYGVLNKPSDGRERAVMDIIYYK